MRFVLMLNVCRVRGFKMGVFNVNDVVQLAPRYAKQPFLRHYDITAIGTYTVTAVTGTSGRWVTFLNASNNPVNVFEQLLVAASLGFG